MRLKEYLSLAAKSFVPNQYRQLTAQSVSVAVKLLWVIFLCCIVLMGLVAIPRIISFQSSLADSMSRFETFEVKFNVSAPEAIPVLKSPKVVIDLEKENRTDEFLLFNQEGIQLRKYVWFGSSTTNWDDLQDVPAHAQEYSSLLSVLAVLFVPSVILVLLIFVAIESIFFAAFAFALIFVVTRLARFHLAKRQLLKITLFALVPVLVLQIIPLAYHRWVIAPFGAYLIIVALASWMSGERKLQHHHHKKKDD